MALPGLGCVLAGRQIVILGRKLRPAAPVKLRWKDPQSPVVHLRSFSDDALGELTWLMKYRFFAVRLPSLFPPLHTEDEQLADAFRDIPTYCR